jgi:peptide/nickel transport system substrate-binding protein
MEFSSLILESEKMINKIHLLFIVLISLTLSPFAFSKDSMLNDYRHADREDTVIFDIDDGRVITPTFWNPLLNSSVKDQGLQQAMMEPLFILNYETGDLIPWLAKSYRQNNTSDEWVITLRKGIKWSDGMPMTADDVVFTINLLLKNPTLGNASQTRYWVKDVVKEGPLSVRFILSSPNSRFILDHFSVKIFDSISILPKHIWQGKDPLTFNNYDPAKGWPVFSGPYLLDSVSENRFVYIRDDNWWGVKAGFKSLPKPKRLIWTALGSEETRSSGMSINELDSINDVSLNAFLALKNQNPKIFAYHSRLPFTWTDPCARNLGINNALPPWNEKGMRWALNDAIDRQEIVVKAYQGATKASKSIFPADTELNAYLNQAKKAKGYKTPPIMIYNPANAKRRIEKQGYSYNHKTRFYEKDGEVLSIHIQTPASFVEKQKIARVIVAQLRRVGIRSTWANVSQKEFFKKFWQGDYQARIDWQSCGSVTEPWSSMDAFTTRWAVDGSGKIKDNPWHWRNKEYTKLVNKMGRLPLNDKKIAPLFNKAIDILMNDLPIIPITQANKILPFNHTYWTNWPSEDNPYVHPPMWWQSAHIIIHNLKKAQKIKLKDQNNAPVNIDIISSINPPYVYRQESRVKGLSTKVVEAVLNDLGIEKNISLYPSARAYKMAKSNANTLIFPIERLPNNEDDFQWVGTISPIQTNAYKLASRQDIQVNTIDEAKPYAIALLRTGGESQFLKMLGFDNLYELESIENAILMLERERVDLALATQASFSLWLENLGLDSTLFEKVYAVEELSIEGYMAFSKETPKAIVDKFREALAHLKTSGGYNRLITGKPVRHD